VGVEGKHTAVVLPGYWPFIRDAEPLRGRGEAGLPDPRRGIGPGPDARRVAQPLMRAAGLGLWTLLVESGDVPPLLEVSANASQRSAYCLLPHRLWERDDDRSAHRHRAVVTRAQCSRR